MFRTKELTEMQVGFVDDQIYFNLAKHNMPFASVGPQTQQNMRVLNYPDCSQFTYSSGVLSDVVKKQLSSSSDFIILPVFNEETEYDIGQKLALAGELKKRYGKEIVLEISYKTTPNGMKKIIEGADNFDILSVFYGVHFGRHISFTTLCSKILEFKHKTGKKVFCVAVPLMFSGNRHATDSYLFPIWELISDGWVRNWRQGGGNKSIRLIDFLDMKNKNFQGWCEKHDSSEVVKYVDTSVLGLFQEREEMKRVRQLYTRMIIDETVNEVSLLTPKNLWNFLREKTPPIYHTLILTLFNQRLIHENIREAAWSKIYSQEDVQLIEKLLMRTLSPTELEHHIEKVVELATQEERPPIATLVSEIERLQSEI